MPLVQYFLSRITIFHVYWITGDFICTFYFKGCHACNTQLQPKRGKKLTVKIIIIKKTETRDLTADCSNPHTFFNAKKQMCGSAGRPMERKWLRWLDKIHRTILNKISKIGTSHICEIQQRYKSFKKGNMPTHRHTCMNGMNF